MEDPYHVDVLATAYAEAGDFDQAVKFEKKAIEGLPKNEEFVHADLHERLKLFEQKKPYHEPIPRKD